MKHKVFYKHIIFSFCILTNFLTTGYAGEKVNQYLPKFLKMDFEFRYRFEYQDDLDFNDSLRDEDGFSLLRTRINIQLIPLENIKFFTQFQDARISDDIFTSKVTFENYMDLRQLYFEFSNLFPVEPIHLTGITIKGGRQELSYGAQRLIGAFNWSNIAQTFDGGKVILNFKPYQLTIDLFGASKTSNKSPREFDDLYDYSANDDVYGYYAIWNQDKETIFEQYLINRNTDKVISFGPSGSFDLDEYTFGFRWKGNLTKKVDYELEAAQQWGDFGSKDINAQMGVVVVGYTFEHVWKPRLAFEFDYASGDSDASDGTRQTFDNLYPTNHLHYGYMDRVSLQNLNNYRLQLSAKPNKKLKLQSDVHFIYLDTYKDSLYSAARTVTRTAAASAGSDVNRHVGNELDLTVQYKFNEYLDVLAGYSHLFAGRYLKQTGANDDANFAYVQTTINF